MSLPQLTFGLNNPDADNTIYVSSTASDNNLTLAIGTTVAATFTPAKTVVDESQASTVTGTLLYLKLGPLSLTAAEFAAITPTAAGWTIVPFPSEQVFGMTPTADTTLQPGASIDITIGAMADAGAQGASASLTVDVYRVGGVTIGNLVFPTHFSVALATPPNAGQALDQDVTIGFLADEVVCSVPEYNAVQNSLSLAFYKGSRGRPVKAGAATEFVLSFVYASDTDGYGALCTTAQVQPPFTVKPGTNASAWKITPQLSQQSPSWVIKPPAGAPIIGTGPISTVGILIQNLVTNFQPGPTVALVAYSGIDGYADGTFTLLLNKEPHVEITSLTVTPNPATLTDGSSQVEVNWEVKNAGTLTLAPFSVDVTGLTSYQATITENTVITLTADGTAMANLGNQALANVTANVLPVINSFVAEPQVSYAGDLPRSVDLSWNVNTNSQLQLLSSVGPVDPNKYSNAGTLSKTISAPQLLTLLPLGQAPGADPVQRSLVLSAFAPQNAAHSVPATYLAAPSNASMVVVSDGNTVSAVDTLAYQPVASSVPAGGGPAGMVFSADGGTLYVANSSDGTVSVLAVAATGANPQYTFTSQATVAVGGAPQRLALSPDGQYLYVSIDSGTQNGKLVVVSTQSNALATTLPVGLNPRGVAVTPSGAQLFVANSGSNTVTVIGRAPNGVHSVVGSISNLTGASDAVVSTDGAVLLVACPGTNSVVAINAVLPGAPRLSLPTGTAPQTLALMPTGAYAVAANQGSNTVSLISLGSTPSQCTVLTSTPVSGAPVGVAITPDAGLLLAGTGTGLSVLTLATYAQSLTQPAVGKQPSDLTLLPDGKTAAVWNNALEGFSPGSPSTGLYCYDLASQTVTQQLSSTAVVGLACQRGSSTGYLIAKGGTSVEVLATGSWTSTGSIALSGGGQPTAVACSADGSALFVVTIASDNSAKLLGFSTATGNAPLCTLAVRAASTNAGGLFLAVAPDASAVYLTDTNSGLLTLVTRGAHDGYAVSGSPVAIGDNPVAAALSPDGSALYVACAGDLNGTLAQVDTASLAVTSVQLPSIGLTQLNGLAVSPDGNRLFATDLVMAGVRVFDAASLRLVQTLSWASGVRMPNGIAVAADGSSVFTANTNSNNLGILSQVQAGSSKSEEAVLGTEEPGEFVAGQQFSDTPTYQGLFLRDYIGQTPSSGNTTGAWTTTPDIWAAGQSLLTDPQTTLITGYNNPPPNTIYVADGGAANYVYVRGQNTVNGPNTSRVWLYYVNGGGSQSMMLWPSMWLNNGITAANSQTGATWVNVTSAALAENDYTYPPFDWSAVPVNGHYCMIAWVENAPLSDPPTDPRQSIPSLPDWNSLAAFVQNNPNMGWLNTSDVPTPVGQTWTQSYALTGPKVGGKFRAGLQFDSAPTDASFSLSILGPTPQGSVNVPKTQITSPGETYLVPVDWSGFDNYQTNVLVTWYAGATPATGTTIQTTIATPTKSMVGLVADPLEGSYLGNVYPTGRREDGFFQENLTTIGMVQSNLTPS